MEHQAVEMYKRVTEFKMLMNWTKMFSHISDFVLKVFSPGCNALNAMFGFVRLTRQ